LLHIDVLVIDAGHASALRVRLADRGHRVRIVPMGPGGGRRTAEQSAAPDVVLVATGQRPLARTNVDSLFAAVTEAGRPPGSVPLVLCAAIDPTADALQLLLERGFDGVFGASHQRELEHHLEALVRLVRRARTPKRLPPDEPAASPAADEPRDPQVDDPAVRAAHVLDRVAMIRAARHWWTLDSIDDPDLRTRVQRLATEPEPVLVRGEAAVGRRHLARVMHEAGRRKGGFVELAAEHLHAELDVLDARLDRLLTLARGGTLCVTNLSRLDDDVAGRLRDATEKAKDVRLVVTAPPDVIPTEQIRFHNSILEVAALRDRPAEALVALVVRLFDVEPDPEAADVLACQPWTRNIDELEEVLRAALPRTRQGVLCSTDLPAKIRSRLQRELSADDELIPEPRGDRVPRAREWRITERDPIDPLVYERKLLLRALAASGGNRAKAAQLLGFGRSTFYRKLRELEGLGP